MRDLPSSEYGWPWLLLAGILSAAIAARVIMRFRSRVPRAESRRIAREIMAERLQTLRHLSYADLLQRRADTPSDTVIGPDGSAYQVETQVFWDEPKKHGGNLRVTVSVDGGAVRVMKPLLGAFIIAPDGSFVGEGSA